ncbi:DUF7108 family protein [Halostella litorea]|uniref:DUF7108 family protein n=1 Tax=Halostella litorea TaxID=2528831 RepID=UPI001092B215|nr:rnhA operon protein [Halostella litorea]
MPELPEDVAEEAERLTRLAREAVDEQEAAAYRRDRDRRLAEHDFRARVREDDARAVLVLHPDEWVEDGTIRPGEVDDTDRAAEIPLDGPGDPDDWESVEAHNAELVERVREDHGEVHAANVRAFADFMGNHYARPLDSATGDEVREFLRDYYPRNAWPSDEQREVVERSLRYAFDAAEKRVPGF